MSLDTYNFLKENWKKLTAAPLVFITCAVGGAAIGFKLGALYYEGRIATIQGDYRRYRVALGIDKSSEGALIELNNAEMRAKAATTAANLRGLQHEVERRTSEIDALKEAGKLDEKGAADRNRAIWTDATVEFESGLRADAINVDNELRRRLGPQALAAIVGLPKSFTTNSGAPLGIYALVPPGTPPMYLGVLANSIDQMRLLLPRD